MNTRTGVLTAALAALLLPFGAMAADKPAPEAKAEQAQKVEADAKTCDTLTGSRIRPRKENKCEANRPLRTFTKEQIEMTGDIDLVDALRQLDPVFR